MKILRKLLEKARRALAGALVLAGLGAAHAQTASNFPVQKTVPGNLLVGSLSLGSGVVLTASNGSEFLALAGSVVDLRLATVSLGSGVGTVNSVSLSSFGTGIYGGIVNPTTTPAISLSLDANLVSMSVAAGSATGFPKFVLGTLTFVGNTVANGFTGAATFASGQVLLGNGTGAFTSTSSEPPSFISGTIQTLSVSGQQLVTLTSGGTLALVAGGNITLTTNSTSRTVTIAETGSNAGTVTSIAGVAGRTTVTGSTSAATVTLPTTLSLSDTTLYLGSISGTMLLGTTSFAVSGNPLLNSASTASTNFGGVFQIGTLSNSSGYDYPGYTQQGFLNGTGMNLFPGGFTGPVDTVSAWWRRLYGVMTTSNSQFPMLHFGDSFGVQVWDRVDPQMQAAVGFAGLGGYDVSVSYSGTATTSTTAYNFNPAGTVEVLTATNDAVTYFVNGNSNGMADAPKFFYAVRANGPVIKVRSASASPPTYTFGAFSDEAGYTAVSTSGSPTTAVVTLPKTPGYAWKLQFILTDTGGGQPGVINFRPAFWSVSNSGVQTYNLAVGGISLSDSNTVSTAYLTPFLNAINPALITYHMSESDTFLGSALDTMKTLWSTSVSSTSWLIMGNPPNGTPGGGENNNPTTAQEVQNGYLSSFAERNAQSGFQYYDIYGFMRNWLFLDSVQMGGDGTHISNTAFDLVATKLIRDMGITGAGSGIYPNGSAPSTLGAAVPQSVYGPTVTTTATVAFTLNPAGTVAPSYYTFRLRTDHDSTYTKDNAVFDVRNNLLIGDGTNTRLTLTLSSGGMRLGAAGSSVTFYPPRTASGTQDILIDQSGSSSAVLAGSPGIIMTNGNTDSGSFLYRSLATFYIRSGSISGQVPAIKLVTDATEVVTITSSGVTISAPINVPSATSPTVTTSTLSFNSGLKFFGGTGTSNTVTLAASNSNVAEFYFTNTKTDSATQMLFKNSSGGLAVVGVYGPNQTTYRAISASDSNLYGTNNVALQADGGTIKFGASTTIIATMSATGATVAGTIAATGTASLASVSATTTSVSSIRVGNTTSFTGMLAYSVSASTGVATVTNSAITTNSVPGGDPARTSSSGTVLGPPTVVTMFNGSMSFTVGSLDTSTYSGVIFIKP
jgi:hypothetical protein